MRRKGRKRSIQQHIQSIVIADPIEAAKAVGLQYVSDDRPGIQRRRTGKNFTYIGVDGQPIRDRKEIERINALAIPPAYQDVWICPSANGHLQATGRDAKGRKQYRYHPLWRSIRDQTKFTRMLVFSQALPTIRQRLEQDLRRPGLPKEKVLAAVVALQLGLISSFAVRYFPDSQQFYLSEGSPSDPLTPEQAYLRLKQLVEQSGQ